MHAMSSSSCIQIQFVHALLFKLPTIPNDILNRNYFVKIMSSVYCLICPKRRVWYRFAVTNYKQNERNSKTFLEKNM